MSDTDTFYFHFFYMILGWGMMKQRPWSEISNVNPSQVDRSAHSGPANLKNQADTRGKAFFLQIYLDSKKEPWAGIPETQVWSQTAPCLRQVNLGNRQFWNSVTSSFQAKTHAYRAIFFIIYYHPKIWSQVYLLKSRSKGKNWFNQTLNVSKVQILGFHGALWSL